MELNRPKNDTTDLGFKWWKTWGWLGLTFGSIYILFTPLGNSGIEIWTLIIFILNTALGVMILKLNKYAFLIMTVLSLNPIVWIINGIYLKNRWKNPKVNS